jgi:thioredoxin 1
MKVELFQVPGCSSCSDVRDVLRAAAEKAIPGVLWREVDPTREFDYAVQLGVLSLPSLAVDGELVFSSLPTATQLDAELKRRAAGATRGS